MGHTISEEHIEKIKKAVSRPVMCVETGVIYSSCTEANKAMPGNLNIQAVAEGRRKSAGGYHWKFVV